MSELANNLELTSLTDLIDELSTRLIIDGVDTLGVPDFERLGQAAASQQRESVAKAATLLAERIAPPATFSVPELTRLISSALVEMRNLLDNTTTADQAPVSSPQPPVAAAPTPSAPAPYQAAAPLAIAADSNPLAADVELIQEFIMESGEHLQTIETQMLVLEKSSEDMEALNAVFRAFHTIKGLAGFLEFSAIQALAHEVETLLDLARSSQLAVTPPVVDIVLESTDVVRQELTNIELRLSGKPPNPSNVNESLLQRIRQAARGEAVEAPPAATATVESAPPPPKAAAKAESHPVHAAAPSAPPAAKPPVAEAAKVAPKPAPKAEASAPKADAAAASVRIDTGKLDQLMDMVGEMVIAQTLIGHSPALASVKDARLLRDLTQLARITADVQKITTGMRMVPIGMQFQKTARVVRDLSRRAGKQIVLETEGEDTELDKNIAEELSDPLLHMVRNSIDHGIETPEERLASGKEPTAHIRLAAYHQSGQIVVAISDDGRGLNKERILAKALQNGLIHAGQQLTDNEIFLLIFEAGFSTAEKITDISGRGVGMDVVRRHVQKLRGRIDIQSKQGQGTTFFIKLPLTLAIIEGLVVIVGDQRYIVPIFSVREMFRPTAEMISTVHGKGEMAMVRGGLMPIVRLHKRFEMTPRTTQLTDGTLIVAESEGKQFCLFVDDLVGKQEVVIKSLGTSFKNIAGIAGCAILGDGRVGLILDVDGIYKGRS
jgi:two-component system chemotaxis sensor kinase CheA